jgi:hypothetical protein
MTLNADNLSEITDALRFNILYLVRTVPKLSEKDEKIPLYGIDLIERYLSPVFEERCFPIHNYDKYHISEKDIESLTSVIAMFINNDIVTGGIVLPLVMDTLYIMGYRQGRSETYLESQIDIE